MTRIVLRAAAMFDGVQVVEHPTVVVEDGRIAAIVAGGEAPVGAKDTVIELGQRSILPGLIDAHVHLGGSRAGDGLFVDPALAVLRAAADARAALNSGFTTLRDCGSKNAIALREAIAEGTLVGPRIVACGPMISSTGGHADLHELPLAMLERFEGESLLADGVEGCRLAVRRAIRAGADWIKVCVTGGNTSLRTNHHEVRFTTEELEALVNEAHRLGRRVAAHATGAAGVLSAVRAGVDSVEHGYFVDDEGIAELRERGTWLVPTFSLHEYFADPPPGVSMPVSRLAKQDEAMRSMRRTFPAAVAAGVAVATGTDCGGGPGRELGTSARELEAWVAAGVAPIATLRAATVGSATMLGLDDRIGRIAVGHEADLIAVDGRPWDAIDAVRAVDLVVRGGRVVRDTTAEAST